MKPDINTNYFIDSNGVLCARFTASLDVYFWSEVTGIDECWFALTPYKKFIRKQK